MELRRGPRDAPLSRTALPPHPDVREGSPCDFLSVLVSENLRNS